MKGRISAHSKQNQTKLRANCTKITMGFKGTSRLSPLPLPTPSQNSSLSARFAGVKRTQSEINVPEKQKQKRPFPESEAAKDKDSTRHHYDKKHKNTRQCPKNISIEDSFESPESPGQTVNFIGFSRKVSGTQRTMGLEMSNRNLKSSVESVSQIAPLTNPAAISRRPVINRQHYQKFSGTFNSALITPAPKDISIERTSEIVKSSISLPMQSQPEPQFHLQPKPQPQPQPLPLIQQQPQPQPSVPTQKPTQISVPSQSVHSPPVVLTKSPTHAAPSVVMNLHSEGKPSFHNAKVEHYVNPDRLLAPTGKAQPELNTRHDGRNLSQGQSRSNNPLSEQNYCRGQGSGYDRTFETYHGNPEIPRRLPYRNVRQEEWDRQAPKAHGGHNGRSDRWTIEDGNVKESSMYCEKRSRPYSPDHAIALKSVAGEEQLSKRARFASRSGSRPRSRTRTRSVSTTFPKTHSTEDPKTSIKGAFIGHTTFEPADAPKPDTDAKHDFFAQDNQIPVTPARTSRKAHRDFTNVDVCDMVQYSDDSSDDMFGDDNDTTAHPNPQNSQPTATEPSERSHEGVRIKSMALSHVTTQPISAPITDATTPAHHDQLQTSHLSRLDNFKNRVTKSQHSLEEPRPERAASTNVGDRYERRLRIPPVKQFKREFVNCLEYEKIVRKICLDPSSSLAEAIERYDNERHNQNRPSIDSIRTIFQTSIARNEASNVADAFSRLRQVIRLSPRVKEGNISRHDLQDYLEFAIFAIKGDDSKLSEVIFKWMKADKLRLTLPTLRCWLSALQNSDDVIRIVRDFVSGYANTVRSDRGFQRILVVELLTHFAVITPGELLDRLREWVSRGVKFLTQDFEKIVDALLQARNDHMLPKLLECMNEEQVLLDEAFCLKIFEVLASHASSMKIVQSAFRCLNAQITDKALSGQVYGLMLDMAITHRSIEDISNLLRASVDLTFRPSDEQVAVVLGLFKEQAKIPRLVSILSSLITSPGGDCVLVTLSQKTSERIIESCGEVNDYASAFWYYRYMKAMNLERSTQVINTLKDMIQHGKPFSVKDSFKLWIDFSSVFPIISNEDYKVFVDSLMALKQYENALIVLMHGAKSYGWSTVEPLLALRVLVENNNVNDTWDCFFALSTKNSKSVESLLQTLDSPFLDRLLRLLWSRKRDLKLGDPKQGDLKQVISVWRRAGIFLEKPTYRFLLQQIEEQQGGRTLKLNLAVYLFGWACEGKVTGSVHHKELRRGFLHLEDCKTMTECLLLIVWNLEFLRPLLIEDGQCAKTTLAYSRLKIICPKKLMVGFDAIESANDVAAAVAHSLSFALVSELTIDIHSEQHNGHFLLIIGKETLCELLKGHPSPSQWIPGLEAENDVDICMHLSDLANNSLDSGAVLSERRSSVEELRNKVYE